MSMGTVKHVRTRRKLQWFFEQVASKDLHSLPLEREIREIDLEKRQWGMAIRRGDVGRMRRVLRALLEPGGLLIEGRRLRLTPRMWEHVVVEFTAKKRAIALLYGDIQDERKVRSASSCYRRTLGRALARIEAAFHHAGVLHGEARGFQAPKELERNAFGYLADRSRIC